MDATLFLPIQDGPAVFMTADTTWFVVGPLASAGEDDGVATVFEFAGWAAEILFENHAVVSSEDMSVLPYLFIDDEIIDALPLLDFLQPRQDVGRPFLGCFQHCQQRSSDPDACRSCFPLLLAVSFGRVLCCDAAGILLAFSGIERVRAFKFPLLLDPGFFEHAVHVWKGKLAKDESEENVSLLNSVAKSFQVPSCGILDGFLLARGVREFWKERHWVQH